MVVLKLGHFSAIFIFTAYCNAPEPSKKAACTDKKSDTDTQVGSNPPENKYSREYV